MNLIDSEKWYNLHKNMGRNIEQLFHLPQPDFEKGNKGPVQVLLRRAAQQPLVADHAPQVADRLFNPFLSPEIRLLRDRILNHPEFSDPSLALIQKNMIFLPNEIFLRASPFHLDNWLRDSFISCLSLNDPAVESHLLDNFTKRKNLTNHVPTTRLFASDRVWYFDDESSALSLIWRAKLADLGCQLKQKEIQNWTGILNWVRGHERNGSYVTPAGTEKSWFDTFVFRNEDVITYNQGVYAVALIAAKRLGLAVDNGQIEKATEGYNCLTHRSGRLQLSRENPYSDVSSFFGEFLGISLFNQSILSKEIVERTIMSFPRDKFGYRVVGKDDGNYLRPSEFNRPYRKGDYHNGANWPLFDMVAQVVSNHHGLGYDRQFLTEELRWLFETQNAEYFETGNTASRDKPIYNYKRINHLWNSACYTIARQLLGTQEYQKALELVNPRTLVTLYSEASQLPDSSL